MEAVENIPVSSPAPRGKLLRVLGIAFGLAICIGSAVGVGILRNPSGVAAQLHSPWLIMVAWVLGGVYCVLAINYLAELATMTPKAGGFYVYAHRAFGNYGGFVVGWSDWANQMLAMAYISVVFGEYASDLLTPQQLWGRSGWSAAILIVLTAVNLLGVRSGSQMQQVTSLLKAVALVGFVVACFVVGGGPAKDAAAGATSVTSHGAFAAVIAFVLAFQVIISTYDGYYGPIYFSEEDTNPSRNIVRSMFGGMAIITVIYVAVNAALLYVLPIASLEASNFAAGDAVKATFGSGAGQIVTVLALISLIGVLNATMMLTPRILLAMGRDRLFTGKAVEVNRGGTPAFALIVTSICALAFTIAGTFELLLGIAQFFFVVINILLVVALFRLRRTEPGADRPFRAWGYPFAPLLMLVFAVLLFVGYCVSNPFPSAIAVVALILSYPLYRLVQRGSTPQST